MTTAGMGKDPIGEQLHAGRRILAVLEILATQPRGVTPKDLSRALQLHLSTCYRLLNTLVASGYAVRAANGHFTLGRRVAYLNHRYEEAVRPTTEVLAFLHALQLASGETALLFRLEDHEVVTTAIVEGNRPGSHPGAYVGLSGPAHAFAAGRVLLAGLPAAQRDTAISRCLESPTLPWIPMVTEKALRDDLTRITRQGYARDDGDGGAGVCCLAAPLRWAEGVPAAVAVVAPCPRLLAEESRTLPVLLEVARAMSSLQSLPACGSASMTTHRVAQAAIEAAQADIASAISRVTQGFGRDY